jgi:hypothetical protein
MLYARGKNDDVASRVIFCALVGSALAIPLKYHNDLLGLVKVPRHSHPWADDVFMYVRLRAELFIRDEIANRLFGPLGTLPSTPRRIGICTLLMSGQPSTPCQPNLPLKARLCPRRLFNYAIL